jgi:hypothetical protein
MIGCDIIYEYPLPEKLIIIGDIHGDIKRFKGILLDANIINNNIEWIANPLNTIVIQMGDQVDSINREENIKEWEILPDTEMVYFTNFLDKIAQSKGGRVISVIGNHEFMNVIGNYSYVSQNSINNNQKKRTELFKPGGILSSILSNRPIIVKIGNMLFSHAGITTNHYNILTKYNKDISHINKIWKRFVCSNKVFKADKEIFDKMLLEDDGILWTRKLDNIGDLKSLLAKLNCNYMFVGHTVVPGIRNIDGVLWYTDTAISRAFGTNTYQYIEYSDNKINIKTIK